MLNVSTQPFADMFEGCIEGCIHGAELHGCQQKDFPPYLRCAALIVFQLIDP